MNFSKGKKAIQDTLHAFYQKCVLYFFMDRRYSQHTTKRCVIYLEDTALYLLYADTTPAITTIQALEKYAFHSSNELANLIGNLSRQYSLQTTPIFWVLNDSAYQLFFLESIAVPEAEMRKALSWRLKSSIQELGEAVIDYFNLPAKSGASGTPSITAIVANQKKLADFLEISKNYRLNLSVIDIPELALHNLTTSIEDDKSTALIYITNDQCLLNITKQKTLYLTRKIKFNKTDNEESINELSLEVLRYFDYFQSYWRYPAPSRIYLIAEENKQAALIDKLSKSLSIQIMPFSITHDIITPNRIAGKHWLLLGELLRSNTDVAPTH